MHTNNTKIFTRQLITAQIQFSQIREVTQTSRDIAYMHKMSPNRPVRSTDVAL